MVYVISNGKWKESAIYVRKHTHTVKFVSLVSDTRYIQY